MINGFDGCKSVTDGDEYLDKLERYELFLQQWAELAERYNDVAYSSLKIFTQVYEDEVKRFFGDELVRWEYMRSTAQINALYNYTSKNSGFINKYLRNGSEDFNCTEQLYLQKQVSLISSAIVDFNLQRNILVYRVEEKEYNTGDAFTLNGFTSASINRRLLAINFDDCVQYQIEVPSGKGRGAYICNQSKFKSEYEFLLQRNTKSKVIRRLDDGEFKMIKLRVID